MPDTPLEEITDLGYIVGQDADWPNLGQEVRARGPLTGPALQRLAIATMTGLAALHRAGVIHRAVRPDTVLLGPNGPRLRYPVPEQTHHHPLDPGDPSDPCGLDEATVEAGTLTWSTPEKLKGLPADRPGDLFGWAATMAFAATGHSPFGGGSTAGSTTARVNRLLHGAADLGPLEGVLRDLVADCLTAEAADRPTAEDALLRLIGYSGALDSALPAEPSAAPARPTGRSRSRVQVLAAAGLAIALVSGGATYLITQDRPVPASRSTPVASAPVSGPAPVTTAPALSPPGPVPKTTKRIALPGGGTLYEHPADPVKLASYRVGEGGTRSAAYARRPGSDGFQRAGGPNVGVTVSPDGRWLASVNELYISVSDRQDAAFTDRRTGARFTLPVASAPDIAQFPTWSHDSRKLILTVHRSDQAQGINLTRGFVILDLAARTSTFVPTSEPEQSKRSPAAPTYRWTPDGNGVAAFYTTPESTFGVRFRDLRGQVTRSMHWVGHPVGEDWFSPSGGLLVTTACGRAPTCVWDAATGQRRASVPGPGQEYGIGWYDDAHLIRGTWSGKDTFRVAVIDFTGRQVRVLADLTSTDRWIPTLSFTRG